MRDLSQLDVEDVGRVSIEAPDEVIAGSMETIRIVYTAGKFGIDDQGSIRLLFRFATDSGRPQWDRPADVNYVTAEASNGANLLLEYHPRGAPRPWFKSIRVNVMNQFLREGDRITLTLGDRREGSAGYRIQSLREPTFEIRVQADPWGTVTYRDVPCGDTISVMPGKPCAWVAILPTLRAVGDRFSLHLRAEDKCGNPTDRETRSFKLKTNLPIDGLPRTVNIGAPISIGNLSAAEAGDVLIEVEDENGALVTTSNPMRVLTEVEHRQFWGDLHAQSEETIGTNSARDHFVFARDLAFCDFVSHQGNDFQITDAFWKELNELYREFDDPGRFVTLPGYEFSPVTALGGDRNIFFPTEDRPIRRSSHALLADTSDIHQDCHHVADLYNELRKDNEECIAFAHVGGRYADLHAAHDGVIERSIEIHSSWGTFEWLLFEAFDLERRVGIVCNSDDHKGRPGAAHPGSSIFGAYGGLTCLSLKELSRAEIWNCLKHRRHFGTTGARLFLDVRAQMDTDGEIYHDDPRFTESLPSISNEAEMGNIVRVGAPGAHIVCSVLAGSPIERIELRRGKETLEIIRPYGVCDLGRRVRLIWEGAENRGRGRMTTWNGSAEVQGNSFQDVRPINFWHLEKELRQESHDRISWESVTTGNFAGANILLKENKGGAILIDTNHVKARVPIDDIGFEDKVFEAGGLSRRLRLFRLPDENLHYEFSFNREVEIIPQRDNPFYVCVTLENGHQAWSSPIYMFL